MFKDEKHEILGKLTAVNAYVLMSCTLKNRTNNNLS